MKIPFVDLLLQYNSIKDEIDKAIFRVIKESAFIKGKYVDEFEKEFCNIFQIRNCIGVANGTDAIYIILKMLGIGEGDEVITTALSWISTSEAISQTGAKPIFVDIDEYYTIDVNRIEAIISNNTKAIIPVHLYGQPAQIDTISKIALKYNIHVIEDCAQSHFAEFNGEKLGTFGIAATFSFYPGKNLGAYGDAGAIITNDDSLAERCRMYANHGAIIKHHHMIEGINSRLDGLQASILMTKLRYIFEWNNKRLEKAVLYNELLRNIPFIQIPHIRHNSKHIFHIYCIEVEKRDELQNFLLNNGIETQIHYPTALPFLNAYKYLNHSPDDFPVANLLQHKILSLPMYPELSVLNITYIAEKINEFYSYSGGRN